jgi:uncharacterized protein YgiM (DUF1202 family)
MKEQKYSISVQMSTFAGKDTGDVRPIFETKATSLCPNGYKILNKYRHYDIFVGAIYNWTIQCNPEPEQFTERQLKEHKELGLKREREKQKELGRPERETSVGSSTGRSGPTTFSSGTTRTFTWDFSVAKAGPGNNYPVIATFRKGDKLTILEQSGEWVKVRSENNQVGWIRSEVLE